MGAATARKLAQQGAKVAVLDWAADQALQVVESINAAGEAMAVPADISDPAQVEASITQIMAHWGRLDIIFANAGINGVWAPIDEITPEEWQRTVNINLNGTFYTLRYAVPHMKQNGGSIIITSSVNGTRNFSLTGATAYSSTKAAEVAMAKMLALELARYRIRVNFICPGSIDTKINESTIGRNLDSIRIRKEFPDGNRIPLTGGPRGSGDDVADVVLFLASDAAKHLSGTEIFIDGAQSLV
jgi:NAD(P)-dependent dehydrogenase (short-subunit alcohol dehydrogenase family)